MGLAEPVERADRVALSDAGRVEDAGQAGKVAVAMREGGCRNRGRVGLRQVDVGNLVAANDTKRVNKLLKG